VEVLTHLISQFRLRGLNISDLHNNFRRLVCSLSLSQWATSSKTVWRSASVWRSAFLL